MILHHYALYSFQISDFFREDSIAPPVDGEQREDESPDPVHFSSFAVASNVVSDENQEKLSEENQPEETEKSDTDEEEAENMSASLRGSTMGFVSSGEKVLSQETSEVSRNDRVR